MTPLAITIGLALITLAAPLMLLAWIVGRAVDRFFVE